MSSRDKLLAKHWELYSKIGALSKEISELEVKARVEPEMRDQISGLENDRKRLIYDDARNEVSLDRLTLDEAREIGRFWYLQAAGLSIVLVGVGSIIYGVTSSC
jgi:hypothetical protein